MSARPRSTSTTRRWLVPTMLALIVVVADQLSKRWVLENLGPQPHQRTIFLVGDWLSLVYSRNTGVAFGLFQNLSQLFTVTSIIITIAAIYAYAYHLPNHSPSIQIAIGLVIGGALGNIIDRLRLGYVVDFISVGWWPIFNLADSGITVGVTILAVYLIFVGDEPPPPRPAPRDDGLLHDLLSRDVD